MPSQKKLKSVCHNITHHATSGLCYLHPHLHQACRAAGMHSIKIDLMCSNPYPKTLKSLKTLELSIGVLKNRFEEILAAEKFVLENLTTMLLKLDFISPDDDYCCNGHGLLITQDGKEFRQSVDYLGNTIEPENFK